MKLLSEQERVSTLEHLKLTKEEIETILDKLPISMKTMALQNKKTELERKLVDIEKAISTFSRKEVYIKMDQ